jgi:pSer/pThr/pTyr-binding forkhead associated (FHA) protein
MARPFLWFQINLLLEETVQPKTLSIDIDLTRYDTQKIVSRRHAMIQRKGDEFWLYDLNSRNGTFVNGKRLSPREAHILKMGDVVEFGNGGVKLTFNI